MRASCRRSSSGLFSWRGGSRGGAALLVRGVWGEAAPLTICRRKKILEYCRHATFISVFRSIRNVKSMQSGDRVGAQTPSQGGGWGGSAPSPYWQIIHYCCHATFISASWKHLRLTSMHCCKLENQPACRNLCEFKSIPRWQREIIGSIEASAI